MPATPYVVGQWVRGEKFYGRAALIEEVLEGHRNWLWLLGTRRIGKTSLLKQLETLTAQPAEVRYFPVFWDFQGAEDPDELHRGFGEALLDAEDRLRQRGIAPADLEGVDLFDSLGRLRRRLRAFNMRLLLLCDEVEELINLHRKDPAFLSKLRHILQAGDDIRSVLASTIRLWVLAEQRGDTSPFLHGFTPPLYIHRLGDEEARALIMQTNLPAPARPPVEEGVVEEIRRRCDHHPYLMQMVCKRYLELHDLDDAIDQVAAEKMVSHFFSVDFEMLSPAERDVLRIIAESSSANSDSIMDKIAVSRGELGGILLNLENLGYIRRNAERRFELVNYFFRGWLRESPSVSGAKAGTGSQETTRTADTPAEVFDGRYRLLEEIGRGGTGVVWKARDEMVDEIIAIKILKPEYCSDTELVERVRREILLSRDIGHPNILRVYHLGDCKGRKYLAMKFMDGPMLAALIRQDGPLAIDRTVEIGCKLASALEALHQQKIIHRDIKPQNILLDGRGEPYLADFGLARLLSAPGLTESGVFLGTPDYASPEQAGRRPSDERSDLYSMGVVLFEMATGKRPFVADTSEEVLQMHRTVPPPVPRQLRSTIPDALSVVILRCLEKDPPRRYQSARALRVALEGLRTS